MLILANFVFTIHQATLITDDCMLLGSILRNVTRPVPSPVLLVLSAWFQHVYRISYFLLLLVFVHFSLVFDYPFDASLLSVVGCVTDSIVRFRFLEWLFSLYKKKTVVCLFHLKFCLSFSAPHLARSSLIVIFFCNATHSRNVLQLHYVHGRLVGRADGCRTELPSPDRRYPRDASLGEWSRALQRDQDVSCSSSRFCFPPQIKSVFLQWLPWILRMGRPGRKITRKTIILSNRMKELELKERSSKSLLANVLDIDDDFRHPCSGISGSTTAIGGSV